MTQLDLSKMFVAGPRRASGWPSGCCPVGLCHGSTGDRLPGAPLCEQHTAKLSPPMADRVAWAAKDGELDSILDGAIAEARKNDDRWPPFGVIHAGRVETFEDFPAALRRALSLDGDVRMTSRATRMARELARVYVAHVEGQGVIGYGSSMAEALTRAEQYFEPGAGVVFSHGEPLLINTMTGASLGLEKARALARR